MKIRKLFVAFLLAAATCFGIFAVAACGISKNVPEGPETGVYYYDDAASGKTYTVSLHDGNKADFKVKAYDVSGKYTVEGDSISFTFKDEPKTLSGVLADEVLTVTLDGDVIRLWKQVNYTVTYQAGGKTFKTDTVMNGKSAVRPETDPVNGENVFIGWYTDNNTFRNLYAFTQPVRGNITLYARFIVPIEPEFKATLDYNYEGAPEPEERETAGGKLFNLPTPSKAGSAEEFAGWWVSQDGTSDALTYRYQEQQLFENTTLYAVWDDGTPLVSIDENGVSWTSKGVNNNYTFKFTGPDGETIANGPRSSTNYPFNFANAAPGKYTAEVTLAGKTGRAVYNNKTLAHVSVLKVEGNKLLWNAVPNATRYRVDVVCGDPAHVHGGVVEGGAREYDFSGCTMPEEGGIKFTVTAEADGFISSASEELSYDRTLEKTAGLSIAEATATLSWQAVEHAESYKVFVQKDGGEPTLVVETETLSATLKYLDPATYTVSVLPVAHGWHSPEATAVSYEKVRLAAPQGFTLDRSEVRWQAVEGADYYQVTVNGSVHTTNVPYYDLSGEGGTGASITVRAMKTNDDTNAKASPSSEPFTVSNGTMGTVSYERGEAKWDAVYGTTGYIVKVNDDGEEMSVNATSCEIVFQRKGENTIYVCGVLDGGKRTPWATTTVEVFAVYFDENNGDAPVETIYKATGDPLDLGDKRAIRTGYTFTGWYTDEEGQEIYTSSTFSYNTDITLYAQWRAKTYTVTLVPDDYGTLTDAQTKVTVTYDQPYDLSVPEFQTLTYAFVAWRNQAGGAGIQYTDEHGHGLNVWKGTTDVILYPHWMEIFEFSLNEDKESWSVSKGEGINYVTEVTIPATYVTAETGDPKPVTVVQDFSNCNKLEVINIPDCVEEIPVSGVENVPFMGCNALRAINIIGESKDPTFASEGGVLLRFNEAVQGRKELMFYPVGKADIDYTVPYGVQAIVSGAFRNSKFKNVTIPVSVFYIGTEAFSSCTKLESVTFDGGQGEPLTIGEKAFHTLAQLKDVTLSERMVAVDSKMFYNCNALYNINFAANTAPEGYSSVDGLLVKINGGVRELAFYPLGRPAEFTVPEGITSIGKDAISRTVSTIPSIKDRDDRLQKDWVQKQKGWNTQITSVTIPGWVTNIADGAFEGCTSLTQLFFQGTADSNHLTIGKEAFAYCNIRELNLPENLVSIGESAFHAGTSATQGLNPYKSVTLPASLEHVGSYAFGGNKELTEVTVNTVCDSTESREIFAANVFGTNELGGSVEHKAYVTVVHISAETFVNIADVFGAQVEELVFDGGVESNPYYSVVDGVYYNKEQTEIVFFPAGHTEPFTFPETITEIPANLLRGKTDLTEVTIPATVTAIGDNAFQGCTGLTKVTFLTALAEGSEHTAATELTIGSNAFYGCTQLTSIVLPEYTTSIGAKAFAQTGLTSFTIPKDVTELGITKDNTYSIDYYATFEGCSMLESIEVAAGNTTFESHNGVLYLKNEDGTLELLTAPTGCNPEGGKIVIPSSVTKIWPRAFYIVANNNAGNYSVEEICFENNKIDGTLTIGEWAFWSMSSARTATKLSLPEGLTELLSNALYGAQFEEIELPVSLTLIHGGAFSGCNKLNTVTFRAPEKGAVRPGLTIGDGSVGVFQNSTRLTSIVLPEGTVAIGDMAFYNSSISSITIPSTVTSIGSKAFYSLTLTQFTMTPAAEGASLTIGEAAFQFVKGLLSISIPNATSIGKDAFNGSSITSVTFGDVLETIGENAFKGSSIAGEISFPATIKSIGKSAFEGLAISKITFVTPAEMPAEADRLVIGENAFKNCSLLNAAELEKSSVKEVGNSAFVGTKLTDVTFPWTIGKIGDSAFAGLTNLGSVTFKVYPETDEGTSSLSSIGTGAFNYTSIEEFNFPNSSAKTITLAQKIFVGCSSLTSIYLSAQVLSIDGVFNGCSSVTSIKVAPDHPNFSTKEGDGSILYDQLGKSVILIYAELPSGEFQIAYGATMIGAGAFKGQTQVTTVKIPNTVLTIGDEAFLGCLDLEKVIFYSENEEEQGIMSSLTSIGASAFKNCINLTTIELEKASQLTSIGEEAFRNCRKLTKVDLSKNDGLTGFGDMAKNKAYSYIFAGAGTETTEEAPFTVSLPSTMTFLGLYTFNGSGLRKIDLSALTGLICFGDNPKAAIGGSKTSLFMDCALLTEVVFPENLAKIGAHVFENCVALKKINLEKVTDVGESAFNGCTSLSGDQPENLGTDPLVQPNISVDLSEATNIGKNAFANSGVVYVKVGSNLGSSGLGQSAFENCTSLRKVDLTAAASLTKIGQTAFHGCINLTSIELPASGKLTTIDKQAFGDSGLTGELVLPDSVTTINAQAYENTGITSVTLPQSLTKIDTKAFAGTALTSIVIPNTVTSLGAGAFYNCTALKTVTFAGTDATHKSKFSATGISGPSSADTASRTSYGAFEGSGVDTVNFGDRVVAIAAYMFYGCKSLKSITIPSTVTTINAFAFAKSGLTTVTIPETVTTFGTIKNGSIVNGGHQFMGCESLTSVKFDTGFDAAMSPYIFSGCTSLQSFTFPEGMTEISMGMFKDSGLKSIDLEGIETINAYAFQNTKLEKLVIPATVTSLVAYPGSNKDHLIFADCSELQSVTFETDPATGKAGVTDLGIGMFQNCPKLTQVVLADGIIDFGDDTFVGCSQLQITLPESVELLTPYLVDFLFHDKGNEITVPDQIKYIGDKAFQNARFTKINLPDGVIGFGSYAFAGSALSSIKIPASLQVIGDQTFRDCLNLATVDFSANTTIEAFVKWKSGSLTDKETSSSYVFANCPLLTTVDLPASLTYLGQHTFEGSGLERIDLSDLTSLTKLTSLTTSSSIVGQSSYLFVNCTNLSEVILPETLTGIGNYVFQGCVNLTQIDLSHLTMIGNNAFDGSGLTEAHPIVNVTANFGTAVFQNCKDLKKVTLQEGLTELKANMFNGCSSLVSVNIPASVTKIAANTFTGCPSLKLTEDVVLNGASGFTLVGDFYEKDGTMYAYAGGTPAEDAEFTVPANIKVTANMFNGFKVKKLIIAEGTTKIETSAYAGITADEVVLPETLTEIGNTAFSNAVIGEITIPEGLLKIGNKTFQNATIGHITINSKTVWTTSESLVFTGANIGSIDFAAGVTIGQQWFAVNGSTDPGATLPADLDLSGVVTIGKQAFDSTNLQGTLTIPTSVTSIGAAAFKNLQPEQVVFAKGEGNALTIEDGSSASDALFGTTLFATIELPERLVKLGAFAFAGNAELTSIVLPEGVTEIGKQAFDGCTSLTSVSLPSTLLTIGEKAFFGCEQLGEIFIPAKVASIGTDAFAGCKEGLVLRFGMSRYTYFSLFGADFYLDSGFEFLFGQQPDAAESKGE